MEVAPCQRLGAAVGSLRHVAAAEVEQSRPVGAEAWLLLRAVEVALCQRLGAAAGSLLHVVVVAHPREEAELYRQPEAVMRLRSEVAGGLLPGEAAWPRTAAAARLPVLAWAWLSPEAEAPWRAAAGLQVAVRERMR